MASQKSIYTVGGTVQVGGGIYIERPADRQLLEQCRKGEVAFIFSPRQMGKSSLIVHAAEQLEAENIRAVIVDLQRIGVNVTEEKWYLGLLSIIAQELNLQIDIEEWWIKGEKQSPTQRADLFFRDVVRKEIPERVVIFLDEIDYVQTMDFSNQFFSLLRGIYQSQSFGPNRERFSFVLAGTSGLISNNPQSPLFNFGYDIELTYLTIEEALPLATQLQNAPPQILEWVFEWTSGHPYLTMRLLATLGTKKERLTKETVAQAVQDLFLGRSGRQDSNLSYVQNMLLRRAEKPAEVLRLYAQVLENARVTDDYRPVSKVYLKMSGVVRRVPPNLLRVSNQIYATVFDQKWVEEQLSLGSEDADTLAPEGAAGTDSVPQPEIDEAERARRLQAVIEANRLVNNRSQPVFNDRAQGEDQLGIKEEVEALAETLLLRDVEPPIAVGVMGGWGSGKSFVMYLVSRYVEQTRAKRIKKGWSTQDGDPDVPAYVGHIYQINFNAWTYAKSNLWASLMDTIFTYLNRQMQLERLFAYQGIAAAEELPAQDIVNSSLMTGGDTFRKIYRDDYQIDLDADLSDEARNNLSFWSERLLSHNLLWQVMRNQNENALQVMREDEQELEKYKARRAVLEQARQTETVAVSELDEKISRPAYFALLQTTLLSLVSDSLSKTTREELKKSDLDPEKLEGLKKETETLIKGSRGLLYAVGKNTYFWIAGISIAVLALAFSYIWGLFGQSIVARVITPAIALVSALAPFYPTLLTRWRNVLEYETKTKKAFEDALEAQRTKVAEDIAAENSTYAEKVKKLEDEVGKGSLPACDVLIRLKENQIEQQRRKIGPAARYATLMEFVQSRLDSATYENQLGLMHQVRRDIDELTYSLVSSANNNIFPRGKPRVILYIDDLDRCPPQRVVEILEAVQLLLNTKLFVVILGLDTRYVTRALEKEYKEILQHEGDPSGLDYIEKIIQIPYRVRPIERDSLQKYLAMQMDVEQSTRPEGDTSTKEILDSSDDASGEPAADLKEEVPAEEYESVMKALFTKQVPVEIELPAAVIEFKQEDLEDLTACCQQITLTPRSIKRVVNVFKLMKIFWFRAGEGVELAKRDQPRPVKQGTICLLALSSAYPEVMREVFVHLENLYRHGQGYTRLFAALNNIKLPPGSAHELAWQFQRYKQDVGMLKSMPAVDPETLDQLTLEQLNFSTFNLVRSFSFVGDPVYWTDDEDDKGRANGYVPMRRVAKVNRN